MCIRLRAKRGAPREQVCLCLIDMIDYRFHFVETGLNFIQKVIHMFFKLTLKCCYIINCSGCFCSMVFNMTDFIIVPYV